MKPRIAVVVPCYKVSRFIMDLLGRIGPEIERIFVIDDCCPEATGKLVQSQNRDPRVKVIFHQNNKGVGGAVISGYLACVEEDLDIAVKLDGDGQMDPVLLPGFVKPIAEGLADYTKGNRFYSPECLIDMPAIRLVGNAILSFVNKTASGYWNLMDPTNGYTAIAVPLLKMLPLQKLDQRYFFESDMLFRLNTIRAVVTEIPMNSKYGSEKSNLNIKKVSVEFPGKYMARFLKRLLYNYFLRDFNTCSLQIVFGLLLFGYGFLFGAYHWLYAIYSHTDTPIGTVMLAALPVILGFQLLLSAVTFDATNIPREPVHTKVDNKAR